MPTRFHLADINAAFTPVAAASAAAGPGPEGALVP